MSQLPIELVLPGTMYGLLYRKGSGPARSFYRNISQSADGWSGADTFALTCRVFFTRRPPILRIEAFSAGFFAGNRAYVTIDMRTVEFSWDNRGLNVVAFNGYGTVVNIASFDTWANQTAADRFASLIEGLPAGTGVAVVIVDEGTYRLNDRAIQAIKSLGGSKLGSVAFRGSYALIGCKGRSAGCVAEAFSPSGSFGALVKSYTPGAEPGPSNKGNWLSISTYSSSHNYHILLDGVEITPNTTFKPGIQLLAVGQQYPVVDEVLDSDDNVEGLIEAMREHAQTVYAMYIPGSCSGTRAATSLGSFLGSTKMNDLNGRGRLVVGIPGGGSGSALEHMFVKEFISISFWTGSMPWKLSGPPTASGDIREPTITVSSSRSAQPPKGSTEGGFDPFVLPTAQPTAEGLSVSPVSDKVLVSPPYSVFPSALARKPSKPNPATSVDPGPPVSSPESLGLGEMEHTADDALPNWQSDGIEWHGQDQHQLPIEILSHFEEAFVAPMIFHPDKYVYKRTCRKPMSAGSNLVSTDHTLSTPMATESLPIKVDNANGPCMTTAKNSTQSRQEGVVALPASSGDGSHPFDSQFEAVQPVLEARPVGQFDIPNLQAASIGTSSSIFWDCATIDIPLPSSEVGFAITFRLQCHRER
ncbi:hypothetical protein F5148DRAFT_133819 [Russula earlei]|uniref:Uncharacterized protein n=1 Tax=Russula earlei TaxID=71964 RepID=A0ACC0TR96_9AGAM|nr:hypothetical protein F5148DRAFT_133819 [Russula earlei]